MQTNINENVFRYGIYIECVNKVSRFLFPVLFAFPLVTFPHADLELQINVVTAQIAAEPDNYLLYEKRGHLHRRHSNYLAALRDFEKISKIDPENENTEFHVGRTLYESGQADKAVTHLREFLRHHPQHSAALLVFARTLSDLGHVDEASDYYRRSINNAPVKTPDQFVEWSQLFLQPNSKRPADARDVLNEGIAQLGPVVSLVDHTVSLQQSIGDYGEAIRHLKLLPDELQTTPKWLVKQADCVYALGDLEQSTHLYHQALEEITALPQARRQLPAMLELKIYIDAKLSS